jgi:glycosyltransferase involved in cell wall biosynthesis
MSSRKKAAHICHMTSVHPARDIRIFKKECLSLVKAGYCVSFITPEEKNEIRKNISLIGISTAKRGHLFRLTVAGWKVFQAGLKMNADIYHFHDPELLLTGLLLRLFTKKKIIYDVHEDYSLSIQTKSWLPLWIRKPLSWLFKHFENFSVKHFHSVISATPTIAKRFDSINTNSIIVQNFPLLEEFSQKEVEWQQRYNAIIYVGVIHPFRGIKEMINALEIVQKVVDAKLILAGSFYPESLKEEVESQSGWKHVEYKGVVSHKELATLLAQVKAGLVLIHPIPRYKTSYPTKLFEYMAAGIPVVASDFKLWRKIIEGAGCGFLIDPLNPKAIADSIIYLLEHPKEAEEMGKRGIKAVEEKFNWSKEEEKLLQLYRDLLR